MSVLYRKFGFYSEIDEELLQTVSKQCDLTYSKECFGYGGVEFRTSRRPSSKQKRWWFDVG